MNTCHYVAAVELSPRLPLSVRSEMVQAVCGQCGRRVWLHHPSYLKLRSETDERSINVKIICEECNLRNLGGLRGELINAAFAAPRDADKYFLPPERN